MRAKTIAIGGLAMLVLAAAACGEDTAQTAPTVTVAVPSTTSTTQGSTTDAPPPVGAPSSPAETPTEDPRENALERDAERTAREYVEALDGRDGAAVCALLAPGAMDEVELPEPGGDCAASLEASIGYRDPRGLPVWEGATVPTVRATEIGGETATVVATVVTRFADRDEDSIEDDVVYLTRVGNRWLVTKASSTLYRAVGIADVPPSVLSPPD